MKEAEKLKTLAALLALSGMKKGNLGMPGMEDMFGAGMGELFGSGMFPEMDIDDDCTCPSCTARREASGRDRPFDGNPFAKNPFFEIVPKSAEHILAEAEKVGETAKAAHLANAVTALIGERKKLTEKIERNGKGMTEERERLGKEINDLFQNLLKAQDETGDIQEKLETAKKRAGKANERANRVIGLLDTVRNIVASSNGDSTATVAQIREALGISAPMPTNDSTDKVEADAEQQA